MVMKLNMLSKRGHMIINGPTSLPIITKNVKLTTKPHNKQNIIQKNIKYPTTIRTYSIIKSTAIISTNNETKTENNTSIIHLKSEDKERTNIFKSFINKIFQGISKNIKELDSDAINEQIKTSVKQTRIFMTVLPIASLSATNIFLIVTKAVSSFIKIYLLLLFLRVLLSWFPTFKWDQNPWIMLRQVTDPYLNLFRGLVPALLGTIDFTPLLGFVILQWLAGALEVNEEDRYW